jgi:conjugal transfer/entry exclusion protein
MHEHIEKSTKKIVTVEKKCEAVEKKFDAVEKEVRMMENEFQDYTSITNRIVRSICLIVAHNVNVTTDDENYFATEAQKLMAYFTRFKLTT